MGPFVLLGEIAGFMILLCALHALKPRLGLVPLYLVIGLLEVFLFVAGKAHVVDGGVARLSSPMLFSDPANVSYMLFLPLMLGSLVLVYVLEGTRTARRLMAGIAILYVVHGAVDLSLAYHAAHPPLGTPALESSVLVYYNMGSRFASLVSVSVDFIVILVGYQFLVNRLPRMPLAIPIFAALVLAMSVDAVVYETLRGRVLQLEDLSIMHKLQAGIAAGLPLSAYLSIQLRRNRDEVRRGILERGALAIIDLRRRVKEIQAQLDEHRQQLAHMRDTFGRYVSNDVVQALMDDPSKLQLGGEEREVTILFADIRGYSTLAEALEPTEVIGFLNEYFKKVTRVILENKGMINEFEGDAVLAVFGAPLELPNHADLAVATAVEMLTCVESLNGQWEEDGTAARWRALGVDGLAIRIGIHTGKVVAGNIGSEARTKYAVIGDTVNTASRVEGLNKELSTSLLLTGSTYQSLADCSSHVVDLGVHRVKGRSEPVQVYTVRRQEELTNA